MLDAALQVFAIPTLVQEDEKLQQENPRKPQGEPASLAVQW